jgi:hypothetical protein
MNVQASEPQTMNTPEIVLRAKQQLTMLTGLKADTVSSINHDDRGWHVTVDLIELKRIPESSDVLGTYTVLLDEQGNLVSYERIRRYVRSQLFE